MPRDYCIEAKNVFCFHKTVSEISELLSISFAKLNRKEIGFLHHESQSHWLISK